MLKRVALALAASELTQKRLEHIEKGLVDLSDLLRLQCVRIEAVESKVERERLAIAELHGKAYRLLKRVQAETRTRTDTEDVPEPAPGEPEQVDEITERLRRRRSGLSAINEG